MEVTSYMEADGYRRFRGFFEYLSGQNITPEIETELQEIYSDFLNLVHHAKELQPSKVWSNESIKH